MKRLRRTFGLGSLSGFCFLFLSSSFGFAASFPPGFQQFFVSGGLTNPTTMALAPDGRIFVCLQSGQLRVIKNGVLLPDPFLTVSVDPTGERGLLGVAFDPNFSTNHFVYIYYTVPGSPAHNRVSKFTANGDVATGAEVPLLDLDDLSPAFTNHNGGALAFGPDGKLYIAVGENAIPSNAQTLSNLLGKVLRINTDGTFPEDNPFFNSATGRNKAIWALGLRNPFSIAFQPGTGRLFINDVGQNTYEEINLGVAGSNYGWPNCEGPCSPPNASFRDPVYYYGHGGGAHVGCALTTGVFYNPQTSSFPAQFVGKYFFADLCSNWIDVIDPNAPPLPGGASAFGTAIAAFPVSLLVSPNGALYYLSRAGTGELWRIDFTGGDAPPEGNLDAATCNTISGWAWDPDLPNSPINVDILVDGNVLATVSANLFRQDLLDAGKGNGQHGFTFTVPASLRNGQSHLISARVTGTIVSLSSTPKSILCGPPINGGPSSLGNFELADCNVISGWAWDPSFPNNPINLDIRADGQLLTTIVADQFRQDLLNAGKGNGTHAFSFPVPASLKNGQAHSISVIVTGAGFSISPTPKMILCGSPGPINGGPSSAGNFEVADCDVISGWAWDPAFPNNPINLDIRADGQQLATIAADQFRQDLLNAGKGNGQHAFSFAVPASLKNGQPHSISVIVTGAGLSISPAPKIILCGGSPGPINGGPSSVGNFEVADCNVISGWAWDPAFPNNPINLDIRADGQMLATIVANQFRQDLLNAGKGNGQHAFSFAVPANLKDGQLHSISVIVTGAGFSISPTPKMILCGTLGPINGGPSSVGNFEIANCDVISGWAWDPSLPNIPINLDIRADGQLLATIVANQFRQDLLNAGIGNGQHAFSFAVPASLKNGQPHSISVIVTGAGHSISPAPKTILCNSP